MARFLQRIKSRMRENEDIQAIGAMPIDQRPILAYAEDDYTWNQLGPYLEVAMSTHGQKVAYVTSEPNDPLFEDHNERMTVFYVRDALVSFLPQVDSPVFLTTMPDLDSFHLKRPKDSLCVYAFHSMNSIHMAYRPNAFDAYDVFMCTGPHQKAELASYMDRIGRTDVTLHEVGYPKLDRIAGNFETYTKQYPDLQTVLIAPSWGTHNVLAGDGVQLVESLANSGYRVVVRPHPAFFESIYPEGAAIVEDLKRRFGSSPDVVLEMSTTTENSFMEADLMISDWSGAAYEYALGTERPVLFIDLPAKTNNPDWAGHGFVPFEERMRTEVGTVVSPGDPAGAAAAVGELLDSTDERRGQIAALRDEHVYNFGSAAEAGAAVLNELVERTKAR